MTIVEMKEHDKSCNFKFDLDKEETDAVVKERETREKGK